MPLATRAAAFNTRCSVLVNTDFGVKSDSSLRVLDEILTAAFA